LEQASPQDRGQFGGVEFNAKHAKDAKKEDAKKEAEGGASREAHGPASRLQLRALRVLGV